MTDLYTRCARHGWTLTPDGDGYELLGNGQTAAFTSEDSLRAWLDRHAPATKGPAPYYDANGITLYHGDCLEIMPHLAAQSFDAIICDPPYGTTACAWDGPIPFAPMWEGLKRLARPRSAIVLFSDQPFTSVLVGSNLEWFKYDWVWEKDQGRNFQLVNSQPLKVTESINVFCETSPRYNPQGLIRLNRPIIKSNKGKSGRLGHLSSEEKRSTYEQWETGYPSNILRFDSQRGLHPTQKPLALMEYLIKTYTNEGDTILDFTCGSGTTLRAAKNLKRRCVGIERDPHYCDVTVKRLEPAFEQALVDDGASLDHLPLFAYQEEL